MRPFAGDEGIHAFRRRLFQAVARAAAHDADPAADGGAGGDEARRAAGGLPQAFGQVCPREAGLGLKPEVQSVVEVEGAQLSEAQRRAEAGVVAEAGMRVQRQMGTVNRQVMLQQAAQQLVAGAGPGMRRRPKKPVMHQQQVRPGGDRQPGRGQARVHRRGDPSDGAAVLDLEAVGGAFVILHPGRLQHPVAVADNGG